MNITKNNVLHFDRGELIPGHIDPVNGNFLFEARATRAGVFLYSDGKGGVRRELRPPEEVGNPVSLASLARRDVTDLHPSEFITVDNKDFYSVGLLDGEVIWEADYEDGFVKVRGVVQKEDAIKSIDEGRREMSCGYMADLEDTQGVWKDSKGVEHAYDAIQRNIRYNHIALVNKGRAGNNARLRVDSDDEIAIRVDADNTIQPLENPMKTIRIDGQDYQMEEPAAQRAVAALEASRASETARADAAEAKHGTLEAKFDAGMGELATTKTENESLKTQNEVLATELVAAKANTTETKVDEAEMLVYANERVKLINMAVEIKLDGFDAEVEATNASIKRSIVEARGGNVEKLDSEVYIDTFMDMLADMAAKPGETNHAQEFGQRLPDPGKRDDEAFDLSEYQAAYDKNTLELHRN